MAASPSILDRTGSQPRWMDAPILSAPRIDHQQLTVLNALIVLTARRQHRAEFAVARDLANAFAIASPRCLSALRFLDALTWLDRNMNGEQP